MTINLRSVRARKARLADGIGKGGYELLTVVSIALLVLGAACLLAKTLPRAGYVSLAVSLSTTMFVLWYKFDLAKLAPHNPAATLDDILERQLLAHLKDNISPAQAWDIALQKGVGYFILNRLLVPPDFGKAQLSTTVNDMQVVWDQALQLQQYYKAPLINSGTLICALILTSQPLRDFLTHNKLGTEDVLEVYQWLERQLWYESWPHANFGGIGRDWAAGFTPTLEHFGENISHGIEAMGGYRRYQAHADLLDGIINSLSRGTAVAIVGQAGTGKTTLVYSLADRLLKALPQDRALQYHQVVSLSASLILSAGGQQLESLLLTLFGEAIHAGNIVLFIDEAQLFFGSGVGAFDISQILLPVLKNRNVRIVAAFTPDEWQRLRVQNEPLASSFSAVVIQEPSTADTMRILEDQTPVLEHRNNILVTFDALRETVRLSGQYMQDQSYPGKALNLLEQTIPYTQAKVLDAHAVQAALEKTRGLKVAAAQAPEADVLLHLEDHIHERMINQVRAVGVVSGALRRGRAGVSNPKRPVGSFLFLGPTGVGKTELAKSLAAVYFGSEQQMTRLDMSEYQQPGDVARLLSPGGQGKRSLMMAVREQPFSVVLLDEVEKAHPNVLNLLLQMLDEGRLTDTNGKLASFRSAIIIATSNAGSQDIIERVRSGQSLDDFERQLIDKLIGAGQFKPELINRFDEVVLFRPLNEPELMQVAQLMLGEVNRTLSAQNIKVELSQAALQQLAQNGYDPEFGARPMRRLIQKTVENAVAVKILQGQAQPGSVIQLDVPDLTLATNPQAQPQTTPQTPMQTPPTTPVGS